MEINTYNQQEFGQAIVNNIVLINGENSSVTTIYKSSDVNFEEIVAYMHQAFFRCEKVKSVKTDVGSIRSGKFKSIFSYKNIEFERNPWTFPNPNIVPEFLSKTH